MFFKEKCTKLQLTLPRVKRKRGGRDAAFGVK
jgi:hypothetical protein